MNDKRKILTTAGLLVAVGTAGTGVAVAAAAAASDEVIVACVGTDRVLRVPGDPTPTPTATPTIPPTGNPSPTPTSSPTGNPSPTPTSTPTISPTRNPSPTPTATPTLNPTATPSSAALASSACRAGEQEISWNRTGPQGPAGPDPFDQSVWGGLSTVIPPQQEATWTGACPHSGLRAVSGGYEITDLAAPTGPIPDVLVGKAQLEPFGGVPRRYEVRAKNRTDRTLSIRIHVLCVPE
ncbi:hypothetical protein AB0G05_17150 [Nonomuraea wenchangensis]